MKKTITIIFLLLLSISTFSQIETNYIYNSNDCINLPLPHIENIPVYDMDNLGFQEVKETNKPNIIAKGIDVSITLDDGHWADVDGGRIWAIAIQSTNASSLTIFFNELNLPKEGYMYIVDEDSTVLYGPVTIDNIPEKGHFLSGIIPGNCIRVYIFEPVSALGKTSMRINKAYCGFKEFSFNGKLGRQNPTRSCDNDVICDVNYEKESYGISYIVYPMGDYMVLSTGFLVMTTDLSFKPYLQTSLHTMDFDDNGSLSDQERASVQNGYFMFNYKNTTCGGSTLAPNYIYNGAIVKAYSSATDFALLELDSSVSNNSALTWLGWDNSSSVPTFGTAIHHPLGNPMKISYEYNSFSTSDYESSGNYNHWLIYFDDGVVKHGSSGSPLLNQNKRVVGQLHGNDQVNANLSYCVQPRAQYGMFNISWIGGGNSDDSLCDWLDPIGTGQTTMDSSHPIYIFGPTIPENSSVYSVQNLPSGYNVTWTYTPHSGTSLPFWAFIPNSPTTNQCTIDNFNKNYINGTLTATITNGATTITTLEKEIRSGDGFLATCSQPLGYIEPIYGNFENVENTSADFSDNAAFAVKKNSLGSYPVTITSPYFSNATITHTSISGLSWQHSGNTITLSYPANDNLDPVLVVTGKSSTDYRVYRFSIYSQLDIPLQLTALVQGRTVTLALTPDEATEKDYSLETLSRFVSQLSERKWDVTVTEATTGKTVYESHTKGASHEINAAEWASGIYVIKASIGNQMLTQKIFVN